MQNTPSRSTDGTNISDRTSQTTQAHGHEDMITGSRKPDPFKTYVKNMKQSQKARGELLENMKFRAARTLRHCSDPNAAIEISQAVERYC